MWGKGGGEVSSPPSYLYRFFGNTHYLCTSLNIESKINVFARRKTWIFSRGSKYMLVQMPQTVFCLKCLKKFLFENSFFAISKFLITFLYIKIIILLLETSYYISVLLCNNKELEHIFEMTKNTLQFFGISKVFRVISKCDLRIFRVYSNYIPCGKNLSWLILLRYMLEFFVITKHHRNVIWRF